MTRIGYVGSSAREIVSDSCPGPKAGCSIDCLPKGFLVSPPPFRKFFVLVFSSHLPMVFVQEITTDASRDKEASLNVLLFSFYILSRLHTILTRESETIPSLLWSTKCSYYRCVTPGSASLPTWLISHQPAQLPSLPIWPSPLSLPQNALKKLEHHIL